MVVCSAHFKFRLSRKNQTERIIRAIDNPYCHILGHPTGRLINQREPYDLDTEKVMEAARGRGCVLGSGSRGGGWLEPDDVLNTRGWKELKKMLKQG